MLILISILIFNEYFLTTKIIHARNVQKVRNIKAKPWSQILCPGSGFLVLGSRSWGLGL